MLHVSAARPAGKPQLHFVRHAVAIHVAVKVEIVAVGLADQDAIVERQDHARQHELFDEDAVPVENTVALARPVHRDAAAGGVLVGAVEIEHEGAHLRDEHPPMPSNATATGSWMIGSLTTSSSR